MFIAVVTNKSESESKSVMPFGSKTGTPGEISADY